jgi:hypothetical protein
MPLPLEGGKEGSRGLSKIGIFIIAALLRASRKKQER